MKKIIAFIVLAVTLLGTVSLAACQKVDLDEVVSETTDVLFVDHEGIVIKIDSKYAYVACNNADESYKVGDIVKVEFRRGDHLAANNKKGSYECTSVILQPKSINKQ